MILRFKNTTVSISFFFALCICLISIFDKSRIVFLNLLSAFLHESGHFLCMTILGETPKKISLTPFGMRIDRAEINSMSFKKEVLIALSGPAVNFLLSGTFLLVQLFFEIDFSKFVVINFAIGTLNLLVCEPLDGYRATKYLLLQKISEEKTERILKYSSLVFIFPVAFTGFYVLIKSGYNFSLLLISVYLTSFLFIKQKSI